MSAQNDSTILFPDTPPRIPLPQRTERLLLRPYLSEDADAFYGVFH